MKAQAKKSSREGKRKKDKSTTIYIVVSEDEETESYKEIREIKHMGTKVSKVSKDKPSGEEKAKKRVKTDKSSMFVEEVEKSLIKDGNLRPLCEGYDTFDRVSQRIIEEASIKYLNNLNMTLIE